MPEQDPLRELSDGVTVHRVSRREVMRRFGIGVGLASTTGWLAACGGGGSADAPTGEPNLNATVVMAAGEDEWPVVGKGPESTTFAYPLNVNVYDTLVTLTPDFELKPGLATSWEPTGPKSWRFHLRKNVTFHDGQPLTAGAVAWSVKRGMAGIVDLAGVKKPEDAVQVVDKYTVDVATSFPNRRLPAQFAHPEAGIVPPGMHLDEGVGTGRFKLVEYQESQQVVVQRHEGYWGEPAKVKRLVVRFLPDPQTRLQALQAGQADFIMAVPPSAMDSLRQNAGFRVVTPEPGRTHLMYINRRGVKPYDLGANKAIRQAVSLAINREAYVETVLAGNGRPGRWMAPKTALNEYARLVKPVPYDPGRARRILEQAGWPTGPDGFRRKSGRRLELTMIVRPGIPEVIFPFIESQLRKVGIKVRSKKAPDKATYDSYYDATEFDLDVEDPNQNIGNPAFLPTLRMWSRNQPAHRFTPGERFDTLAAKSFRVGPEKNRELAARMMRILINEEYIVVPLAGIYRRYGMTGSVNLGDPHPSRTNQSWASLVKYE